MKREGRLWAILDQGVSSASNFAFAVVAAKTLPVLDFGFYAILAAIYWIVIGSSRALVGETLLVVSVRDSINGPRSLSGPGAALAVGVLGGACVALLAILVPYRSAELIAMGLLLPGLAYQDGLRYLCFSDKRYRMAFASDVSWITAFFTMYVLVFSLGVQLTVLNLTVAWGVSGLIATWVAFPLHASWNLRAALAWWSGHKALSLKTWGEFLVGSGTGQAVIFGIPIVTSLYVAAEIKFAQLSVAPWQVTITAISILAVPRIASRARSSDPAAGLRLCVRFSAAVGAAGATYVLIIALIPVEWAGLLFGTAWSEARIPAILCAGAATLIAMSQSVVYLMRAHGKSGRLLLARVLLAPVTLVLSLGGARIYGTFGVALGLVLSAATTLAVWWLLATSLHRSSSREKTPPATKLTFLELRLK